MSPLNDAAPMKMELISVTLDTSHSSIGPCGPSEQSVPRDNFKQVATELLSCALHFGEKMDLLAQKFGEKEITKLKKMT